MNGSERDVRRKERRGRGGGGEGKRGVESTGESVEWCLGGGRNGMCD